MNVIARSNDSRSGCPAFTAPSKPTRRNLDPTPHVVWLQGAVSREARAHRRRPGRRRGSAHDRTSWPYAQVVDDDVLVIETSWPATTIDGDPDIVSGMLSVSRTVGGEFLLNC